MKYSKIMDTVNVEELNTLFNQSKQQLVEHYENLYQEKILSVYDEFEKSNSRIMLLTGPSSSGKTTTAQKIKAELVAHGKKVYTISLDDFFKAPKDMPFWSDGQKNFESIDCLNLDLFSKVMHEIETVGRALFPVYDFINHTPSDKTFEVVFDENTYLIFEGIHALNPKIIEHIDHLSFFKVYVSVHSDFKLNDEIILGARDLRLIRRTLRDSVHRTTPAAMTFKIWKYVIKGEEEYIQPFRDSADCHINSTHGYEPLLYKARILKMLKDDEHDEEFDELCTRLIKALSFFPEITDEYIPDNSLVQEFNR